MSKSEIEISDIDLPDVSKDTPKAKPRIHYAPGESACVNCEG